MVKHRKTLENIGKHGKTGKNKGKQGETINKLHS